MARLSRWLRRKPTPVAPPEPPLRGAPGLRVYIAAPWAFRHAAAAMGIRCEEAGLTVARAWWDEDPTVDLATAAQADWDALASADGLIVLQYGVSEGKAVEQGLALLLLPPTNPILVVSPVGERGSIFQMLPRFRLVQTEDEAIALALALWRPR